MISLLILLILVPAVVAIFVNIVRIFVGIVVLVFALPLWLLSELGLLILVIFERGNRVE